MAWLINPDELANKPTYGRILVEAIRAINERQKAWGRVQSVFYKYGLVKTSLGTPDGGINIPALDALDNSLMCAEQIRQLRDIIKNLADDIWIPDEFDDDNNPKKYNWIDENPDNLYYRTFGDGYTWKVANINNESFYDITIKEILKCIEKLDWIVIYKDNDFSWGGNKYVYISRYPTIPPITPTEVWQACLSDTPTFWRNYLDEFGLGTNLEEITDADAKAYIIRYYLHFPTYIPEDPLLQVKLNGKFGNYRENKEVLQFYKGTWTGTGSPPWNAGTSLLYEFSPISGGSHKIFDLDSSVVSSDGNIRIFIKIKADEIQPLVDWDVIPPVNWEAVIISQDPTLMIKSQWVYPGEIIV